MDEQRRKRPGEGAFGVLMLLLSLVLAWQAYEISGFSSVSSPGAFPMAAAAVMVLAAFIVVIGDLRKPSEAQGTLAQRGQSFSTQITPTAVSVFAGFVIGYATVLDILGFLPASFLFLLAAIHFLHRGSIGFSFGISLLSLFVIYAVFRLIFQVVLPEGIVPEAEIMAWIEQLFSSREAP
jgi:putative tricarboxylic transport membrane protein